MLWLIAAIGGVALLAARRGPSSVDPAATGGASTLAVRAVPPPAVEVDQIVSLDRPRGPIADYLPPHPVLRPRSRDAGTVVGNTIKAGVQIAASEAGKAVGEELGAGLPLVELPGKLATSLSGGDATAASIAANPVGAAIAGFVGAFSSVIDVTPHLFDETSSERAFNALPQSTRDTIAAGTSPGATDQEVQASVDAISQFTANSGKQLLVDGEYVDVGGSAGRYDYDAGGE